MKLKNLLLATSIFLFVSCHEEGLQSIEIQPEFTSIEDLDEISYHNKATLEFLLSEKHAIENIFVYTGKDSPLEKSKHLLSKRVVNSELSDSQLIVPESGADNARTRCNDGRYEESYKDGGGNTRWRIISWSCPGPSDGMDESINPNDLFYTGIIEYYAPGQGFSNNNDIQNCRGCSGGTPDRTEVYDLGDSPGDLAYIALGLSSSESNWLKTNPEADQAIKIFLSSESYSVEAKNFANKAVDALMIGLEVDLNGGYIESHTPDDDFFYQGAKTNIPTQFTLTDGSKVGVTFETYTSDGKSSNQAVAQHLVDGIEFALEIANENLSSSDQITSINIYATTNGKHGPKSNHTNGTAVDINKINGKRMATSGLTIQIKELQKAMDKYSKVRENYGPYFNHKYSKETDTWDYDKQGVSPHKDHIHFTTR